MISEEDAVIVTAADKAERNLTSKDDFQKST